MPSRPLEFASHAYDVVRDLHRTHTRQTRRQIVASKLHPPPLVRRVNRMALNEVPFDAEEPTVSRMLFIGRVNGDLHPALGLAGHDVIRAIAPHPGLPGRAPQTAGSANDDAQRISVHGGNPLRRVAALGSRPGPLWRRRGAPR